MTDSPRFETIYEEHKGLVYNLALSYVHNQEDAQDVTQEVFVKIYQRLGTFDPNRASLKTWVIYSLGFRAGSTRWSSPKHPCNGCGSTPPPPC